MGVDDAVRALFRGEVPVAAQMADGSLPPLSGLRQTVGKGLLLGGEETAEHEIVELRLAAQGAEVELGLLVVAAVEDGELRNPVARVVVEDGHDAVALFAAFQREPVVDIGTVARVSREIVVGVGLQADVDFQRLLGTERSAVAVALHVGAAVLVAYGHNLKPGLTDGIALSVGPSEVAQVEVAVDEDVAAQIERHVAAHADGVACLQVVAGGCDGLGVALLAVGVFLADAELPPLLGFHAPEEVDARHFYASDVHHRLPRLQQALPAFQMDKFVGLGVVGVPHEADGS